MLAQPDLGVRTKESDSQFDGSYDAITLPNGSRETGARPRIDDFPALPSPSTMRH